MRTLIFGRSTRCEFNFVFMDYTINLLILGGKSSVNLMKILQICNDVVIFGANLFVFIWFLLIKQLNAIPAFYWLNDVVCMR
jgi:hypothetical protein